jgi:ABC-2 type transport system permease protein
MIPTLLRIGWLNFRRDVVALGLTFVLPIVFFSIFAVIFGNMGGGGGGGSGSMEIIVVDEDGSEISQRFVEAIDEQDALTVTRAPRATRENPEPQPYDRKRARSEVSEGNFAAAVIIPNGFGEDFGSFAEPKPVEVIHDSSNPMAAPTVSGLLQAAAMTAAPDILMDRGLEQLATFGGGLTDGQQEAVDFIRPFLRGERDWRELDDDASEDDSTDGDGESAGGEDAVDEAESTDEAGASAFQGLVSVNATAARADAETGEAPNIIAYYAAGIGVMFLLFSMAGAGGSILEEEEAGTLERLLTSNVSMGTLLASNWIFFSVLGIAQVALMFAWGAVVFGLELFTAHNLIGFAVMTVFTGCAAAAFGIVLATICRSRAQLSGISTVVILVMSALGGSMVPRFITPFIATTSPYTFNGWALDGYLDVFWNRDPDETLRQMFWKITPEIGVLLGMTIVFLIIARLVARRWETA